MDRFAAKHFAYLAKKVSDTLIFSLISPSFANSQIPLSKFKLQQKRRLQKKNQPTNSFLCGPCRQISKNKTASTLVERSEIRRRRKSSIRNSGESGQGLCKIRC